MIGHCYDVRVQKYADSPGKVTLAEDGQHMETLYCSLKNRLQRVKIVLLV